MKYSRRLHKFISFVLSLTLVFQTFAPALVYAADDATASASVETQAKPDLAPPDITPSPTETPTPTVEPTPTEEITPPPTETPTPSPSPTEEITPVPTPTVEPTPSEANPPLAETSTPSPTESPSVTPTETPAPTPHPSPEPTPTPTETPTPAITASTDSLASLITDKLDYFPTDTVNITGSNLAPFQTYTIVISSTDTPAVTQQDLVFTNGFGSFIYSYQLDGNYRPNYQINVNNATGQVVASVMFTDTPNPLDNPDSTSTEPLSTSSIKFQWEDKSTVEDDFHVERKLGSGSYIEIAVVISTTTPSTNTVYSIEDSSLSCDTEYTYRVRAHRHSPNGYSSYSTTEEEKTLYISTTSVSDLTPSFAIAGSTNIPLLTFTVTSCKSSAKISSLSAQYTGDNKNDIANMKLYQESGSVPGAFDSSSDTLLTTELTPGGSDYEFDLDPPTLSIGANTVQFYLTADVKSSAVNGNKVDARIFAGKLKIDPNNPGGAEYTDWPFSAELSLWNPSGDTTIGPTPDTTLPVITLLGTSPIDVEVGSAYTDAGATASDNFDGDLTDSIVTVNPVNTSILGPYTVTYNVVDSSSNTAVEVTRTVNVVDTTTPTLVSAQTQDSDHDGHLDSIKLTFSEPIDDSQLNIGPDGWDVVDPVGAEQITTGDFANDNILLLTFGEGPTPDTANIPSVTYTASEDGSTHDLSGNELVGNTWSTSDLAEPAVVSATTKDTDSNGSLDAIEVLLSEPIDDSLLINEANHWTVSDYSVSSVDSGATIDDDTILLHLTEKTVNDTGTKPDISYTHNGGETSVHDQSPASNELVDNTWNTIDGAAPTEPVATPAGGDYYSDQSVTLASEPEATIRYTIDGTIPTDTVGTVYSGEITIGTDTTLKAVAIDGAGNVSSLMTETYNIAPVISAEASSSTSETSTTITWTTDDPATSRVIYDTVSHALGEAPNYGYANSTVETDTEPKVLSHSVTISGLVAGTTYYYRTVSHGSPEAVSDEHSLTTTSSDSGGGGGNGGSGVSDGRSDGLGGGVPACNNTKPGSAPTLFSALGGINQVTLNWTEAIDPLTYYLITYGTKSGAQTYGNPNIGGKGTKSYTVHGLSGGQTYYFQIRAGNGCAPGDFSNELSATTFGAAIAGETPAEGFTPGVKGASTELTPTPTPSATPTASVLGETNNNSFPWWLILLLISAGGFGAWIYFRRK